MTIAIPPPDQPVTPRPAASVLMLRDGLNGVEVFMATRHKGSGFMPGVLVFPGGAVDPGDAHTMLVSDPYYDDSISRVACVREAFEEAGILLARAVGVGDVVSADRVESLVQRYRARLCAGAISFSAILQSENLAPAIDLLVPFARWTTPVIRSKRFDARFYLARAPDGQIGAHDDHELIDSRWITPADAFDLASRGEVRIVFATRSHLDLLAKSRTVAAALADARLRPMPVVEPRPIESRDGPALRIPAEIGYDVTEVLIRDVGD